MEIQLEKLMNEVDKKDQINEEERLVRELLEICFLNSNGCKIDDLSKYNSKIFIKVYNEIFKNYESHNSLIKDMIYAEYLFENIDSAVIYVDEEDIY